MSDARDTPTIEPPDPPRRIGRMPVAEAILANMIGLPPGHTIHAIHFDAELGLVLIDIEGDDMPPLQQPPVPVNIVYQRNMRVTAHWQHHPDKTWGVRE